ncbi:CgeB family protein [Desulfonauticus submarinus]
MKILISGSKNEYGLAMSYLRALEEVGNEVEIFEDEKEYWRDLRMVKNKYTHRFFWKIFSLSLNKKFVRKALEVKPDLILVFKGWYYNPNTIKTLKKLLPNTLLFCYNQENPFNTNFFTQFGYSNKWVLKSMGFYDAYFIWSNYLVDKIKRKKIVKNVCYLPFAADSEIHFPVLTKNKEEKTYFGSDISFIGTYSRDREEVLEKLTDYNIKIWGNGWRKAKASVRKKWMKRDVYGVEFSKICNSSKMVLDILRPQMMIAHSMKTFEVPVSRGFLLQTKGGEVANFFKEGEEAEYFSDYKELKEKIDFYLKHDDLRERITQNAYKKVTSDENYTYKARAKKILEVYNNLRNRQ